MGLNENIGRNKLRDKSLPYHILRNRRNNSVNYTYEGESTAETADAIELGETIAAGNAIALSSDGKAYKASVLSADNKPAFAFLLESGESGDISHYSTEQIVNIPGATFTPGTRLYLASGTLNISDEPNETTGNYYQLLGIAKSAEEIIPTINDAIIFE